MSQCSLIGLSCLNECDETSMHCDGESGSNAYFIATAIIRNIRLFIFNPVKAWVDRGRKERRTILHNGDGALVVEGRVLDLRKKMVKWPDFLD